MQKKDNRIIQTQGKWEGLPEIFGVSQLAEFLAIGSAKAYELVRQDGFPSFKVGKMYRVSKEGLKSWINFKAGLNVEENGHKLSGGLVSRLD